MDVWIRTSCLPARTLPGFPAAILLIAGLALLGASPSAHARTFGRPFASPAAAPARAPVIGAPIVIGRSADTPARIRDAGVLEVAITPDPALADGGDGVVTVALARVSARDVMVRRARLR